MIKNIAGVSIVVHWLQEAELTAMPGRMEMQQHLLKLSSVVQRWHGAAVKNPAMMLRNSCSCVMHFFGKSSYVCDIQMGI